MKAPFERGENKVIDKTKLKNLIKFVFSPLSEAEILRLAAIESERTGYSIDQLVKLFTDKNSYNPKMMRSFYENRFSTNNSN